MKKIAMAAFVALLTSTSPLSQAASADAGDLAGYGNPDGDWMIRVRGISIIPDEDSTISPIGGTADFSNEVVPEIDFTYFFNKNIAAELILATAKHDATAEGTLVGDVDVGSAWVVPPTLTLQYHVTEFEGFKPYVGAGVNYIMYLDEDAGSQQSLELDDSFGYALQAGVDIPIQGGWGWNFDVKKIFNSADGKWNGGAIRGNIDLDPWVIGTGVSYRF